jgi:hypothetical protein
MGCRAKGCAIWFLFLAGLIAYCKYLEAKNVLLDTTSAEVTASTSKGKLNKSQLIALTLIFFVLSTLSEACCYCFSACFVIAGLLLQT